MQDLTKPPVNKSEGGEQEEYSLEKQLASMFLPKTEFTRTVFTFSGPPFSIGRRTCTNLKGTGL